MAKVKTSYRCQECGYESPKWLGKCPSCNSWNSMVEEIKADNLGSHRMNDVSSQKPQPISRINMEDELRINTNIHELNRVLGGGLYLGL